MEPQAVNSKVPTQPQSPLPIKSGPASVSSGFVSRLKAFFKSPKQVIITAATVIFLIGGAAAAYFNSYLPNKPENRLVTALANAANQDKVTINANAKGHYSQAGTSNDYDASFVLVGDNNNLSLAAESTIDGSKYSAEVRFIDSNLYFKVSGLSTNVLQQLYPSANTPLWTEIFRALAGINDQWYKFDQTSSESETKCLNSATLKLNDKDKQIFKQAFKNNPPLIIKNTNSASINGQSITKFQVTTADGKSLRNFVDGIASTSFMQSIDKCDSSGKSSPQAVRNEIRESQKPSSPFNIYIDSNNQIKRLEFDFSGQGGSAKILADFKWGIGSVSQPAGAKSIQELINQTLGGDSFFSEFNQNMLPEGSIQN